MIRRYVVLIFLSVVYLFQNGLCDELKCYSCVEKSCRGDLRSEPCDASQGYDWCIISFVVRGGVHELNFQGCEQGDLVKEKLKKATGDNRCIDDTQEGKKYYSCFCNQPLCNYNTSSANEGEVLTPPTDGSPNISSKVFVIFCLFSVLNI